MSRPLVTPTVLLLLAGTASALAGPPSGRRSWDLSTFSWIKRKPAEPGAPANGHPLMVDAAELERALGAVRLVAGAAEEPLFDAAEAKALSKPMAEALALAEPGEDLELLSTAKRNAGFFGQSTGVTARAFAVDGRLNLIVHDARLDYMGAYWIEFRMPRFDFGSRKEAGKVVLKAAGAEQRRPDWIVLPLAAAPVAMPLPQAQPRPEPAPKPTAPAAQAKPALPASVEARLRELKRFRDQNLITEEEYARKKQELLKEF